LIASEILPANLRSARLLEQFQYFNAQYRVPLLHENVLYLTNCRQDKLDLIDLRREIGDAINFLPPQFIY
jgi:hypothetical protein